MWSALLVMAILLSGTASNVASSLSTMQTFHSFYVQQVDGETIIGLADQPPLEINLTEIEELQKEYEQLINSIKNMTNSPENTANTANETYENYTAYNYMLGNETYENVSNLELPFEFIQIDNYTTLFALNTSTEIDNETKNTFMLEYVYENEYTVIVTTVGILENEEYTHMLTFLYYSSPEVNVSNWFGDWITLNLTHSLAKHYELIAKVLTYAAENTYTYINIYSYFLKIAYTRTAEQCHKISQTITTQLQRYNKQIKQAIALAIDPISLAVVFAAGFIVGFLAYTIRWSLYGRRCGEKWDWRIALACGLATGLTFLVGGYAATIGLSILEWEGILWTASWTVIINVVWLNAVIYSASHGSSGGTSGGYGGFWSNHYG
nr:hypothetical protein [Candidatus Baldrarchaeota archaeon]